MIPRTDTKMDGSELSCRPSSQFSSTNKSRLYTNFFKIYTSSSSQFCNFFNSSNITLTKIKTILNKLKNCYEKATLIRRLKFHQKRMRWSKMVTCSLRNTESLLETQPSTKTDGIWRKHNILCRFQNLSENRQRHYVDKQQEPVFALPRWLQRKKHMHSLP